MRISHIRLKCVIAYEDKDGPDKCDYVVRVAYWIRPRADLMPVRGESNWVNMVHILLQGKYVQDRAHFIGGRGFPLLLLT